jgi:hypothetical protein
LYDSTEPQEPRNNLDRYSVLVEQLDIGRAVFQIPLLNSHGHPAAIAPDGLDGRPQLPTQAEVSR